MNKVLWLIILAFMFVGCADDIVIEQPNDLRGSYTGIYTVIENYSGDQGDWITTDQFITWEFTDYKFFFNVDTSKETNVQLCDFSGSYVLKNAMTLSDTIVVGQCRHEFVAAGDFAFLAHRHPDAPDTLFLTKEPDEIHDFYKELVLVKEN